MAKELNNLKDLLKRSSLQVSVLALILDIEDTTVSKWNSNKYQPSLDKIDEIGRILEVSNEVLVKKKSRVNTGLANALQNEYKRLIETGVTRKVIIKGSDGRTKKVNNPLLVKTLREFAENYISK